MTLRERLIMAQYYYHRGWQKILTPLLTQYARRDATKVYLKACTYEVFSRRKACVPELTITAYVDRQADILIESIRYPQTWHLAPYKRISQAIIQFLCRVTISHSPSYFEQDIDPITNKAYCHCRWCDKKLLIPYIETKLKETFINTQRAKHET